MPTKHILNESVEYSIENISINKLRFWPENPRIYADLYKLDGTGELHNYSDSLLQEEIYKKFTKKNHIRKLKKNIRNSGGLTEAIIVKERGDSKIYDVIEGNRRLAACRLIFEKNKDSSTSQNLRSIPCEVLPNEISDRLIFGLLSSLHLSGKLQWDPFEKASLIKRRFDELGDARLVADEMNLTVKFVNKQINIIKLMREANVNRKDKFSYFDVAYTNTKTRQYIKDSTNNRKKIANEINHYHENGDDARTFRDDLNVLSKVPSILDNYFKEEKRSLKIAKEEAEIGGQPEVICGKIRKFIEFLYRHKNLINDLHPTDNFYNQSIYQLDQLHVLVETIRDEMQQSNN